MATSPHLTDQQMIAVIWVETALAILLVVGRTWIRAVKREGLRIDDYLVYLACACLVAMSGLYTKIIPAMYKVVEVTDGLETPGPHFVSDTEEFLRLQFAIILLFWSNLWAVKGSFLAFYKVILNRTNNPWKVRAWWGVVVLCTLSYIGCWIVQFLSCTPFRSYFTLGTCQTPRDIYISNTNLYYASAVDVACDLLIMALPLSIIPKLQLKKGRTALIGIFSVGIFIIVCAIVRLVETKPSGGHVKPDWLCVWSVTESSVAVMVSCAPAFRSLFTGKERTPKYTIPGLKSARSTETDEEDVSGFIPMHPGLAIDRPYPEAQWGRQYEHCPSEQSISKEVATVNEKSHGRV